MGYRDKSRDGLSNRLEFFLLTHFAPLWRIVNRSTILRGRANKLLINRAIEKTATRPHQYSLLADYTSWASLTDRTFTGRHLPPADDGFMRSLPPEENVAEIFRRKNKIRLSGKSTLLFSHFAQWFTDGFLRTDPKDWRKNTSSHDIDVSPVYGLNPTIAQIIRTKQGGKLKSQLINGEEYPFYYFTPDGNVRPEFSNLPTVVPEDVPPDKRLKIFAMGGDRANVQIGYTMINILFLREHNRLCDELRIAQPKWDDERLFQTARCMVTAMLLKIVVEEYINHITPYCFKFKLDPLSFCDADWYRQNWMTVEFNLLYRWHGLVTDEVHLGNSTIPVRETMFNNGILVDRGLGEVFEAASDQQSGEIGLFNTPEFLMPTERASIKLGRLSRLRSYNDYRALCSYPRVERFDQISSAPMVQKALKDLYKDVDQIELYVGLFAEDVRPHSVLAPLMGRMVGIDAFSQALTNPLLSKHVYNHRTYSDYGWQELENTRTLSDILNRNVPKRTPDYRVSFTQPGKSVC